jgi:hypothetical protein
MAKIHTHYDNLKVARQAPREVIRAAYKALSQKYHPDKNPGDEKAARIMAIVNTAYNILSDPVRRKEHDEWIVAEEWEVEWVESTREEGRGRADASGAWEPRQHHAHRTYRRLRDPKWWLGLAGCFAAGIVVALLWMAPPKVLPSALAWSGQPRGAQPGAGSSGADASDDWTGRKSPSGLDGAGVKTFAVTQLVVPAHAPDCDSDLQSPSAPNGEPWPRESGYIPGYPVGNRGGDMQFYIDNSGNASPVFLKIYDLDRRSNVRHAYVQAHASLTIDKLAAGKYEVRYQNIITGASRAECSAARRSALSRGATFQAGA